MINTAETEEIQCPMSTIDKQALLGIEEKYMPKHEDRNHGPLARIAKAAMQIELIEHYIPGMHEITKARADKTFSFLRSEIKRIGDEMAAAKAEDRMMRGGRS